LQAAPKKRGAAQPETIVKINRQQFNKVKRQLENAGKYPPILDFLYNLCGGKISLATTASVITKISIFAHFLNFPQI